MDKIKEICEQLQSTSGKKDKEHILKQNKDNELLKQILYFLLNPYITTGLSDKKMNKKVSQRSFKQFNDVNDVMEYLEKNNTGTDDIIGYVQNFINNQEYNMQEFYRKLFTKSLKLGCAAATVNKVFGKGFIPTFDCMLAEKYFDKPEKVDGKDFTITLKLDGIRCLAVKENEKVSLFSRQGQPIEGLVDVENEIKNIPMDNFVFDGELLISNTDGILSKDQYKATSKIVRKDGVKHGITYRVFDLLYLEEFKNQKCTHTYSKRRMMLERLDSDILMTYIEILPMLYSGNNTNMITKILDKVRAEGEEGIMININDAMYEFKRTNNLLKCKVMLDADLLITDVYEGTGKNVGKLGGIEIEFIYKEKHYRCNCGSGFSDEERNLYWSQPDLLIGKIATIQYFEISKNDSGGYGLRFPVWKGIIRDDKSEISMY